MKKPFWRKFLKKKRRRMRQPNTSLVLKKGPKKHKTEPDRWIPPFAVQKEDAPLKIDQRDLVIVKNTNDFDLGRVTASVGIMIQAQLDYTFQVFVDECLKRFKNLDWGGVTENERRVNDQCVMTRTGIVYGVYTELASGVQIWIATDLDQGVTKVCLSSER